MRYIKLLGLALLALFALAGLAGAASKAAPPGVTQSATDRFVVQQTGVGESLKAAAADCAAFTVSTGKGLITTTTDTATMLVSAPATAVFDIGMQPLAALLLVACAAACVLAFAMTGPRARQTKRTITFSSWARRSKKIRSIRDALTDPPATSPLARTRQLFPAPAPVPLA